jgi:type II secretory pathway pseudopilin PulG
MEVLIVVAILGVAATLSAPSISRMIAGQQARQVVRSLVTEFGAIRADAFIQSQSFDADAISSRLSEHAPDGWRVIVDEGLRLAASGYCTPGRISIEGPDGRNWDLQVAQGDCAIDRATL